MNNEIKEILDDLRKYANEGGEHKLMEYEIKHIQCYITKLQTIEQQYSAILSENAELEEENKRLKELDENYPIEEQLEEALKYKNIYKSRCEKANGYIEENTRWFDSEYAKVYGELCDCKGANSNRLEVLVNPSNLSKILGGDKDVKD